MSGSLADDFVSQPHIALRYGMGAFAFAIAAAFAGVWAIVVGWIALTLAIMALAYLWLGPRVYCKRNGRVPWWNRCVLWPHALGVYVVRKGQFRRMKRPFDVVVEGVILGRRLSATEARQLIADHRVTAVLDMCVEHSEAAEFCALEYRNLPVLDMNCPSPAQLREAAEFIGQQSRIGCVYVHCGIGKSRSAAAVAAHLLLSGKADSAESAIAIVKRQRPASKFTPRLCEALRDLEASNADTVNTQSS
jgi:predicted protein tyrosine phosphatase